MKPCLLKLVLFLLLGAVVNVAVAWGCAMWSRVGNEERVAPVPAAVVAWFHSYSPVNVELPEGSDIRQRRGGGLKLRRMRDWIPRKGSAATRYVVASWRATAGLPLYCLDGATWVVEDMETQKVNITQSFALPLPQRLGPVQVWTFHYGGVLPLRPTWPGFVINMAFYGAILWMVVAVPFALRRHLRIRNGRCPHCAYPLGTSAVCTECGKAVKPRHIEPAA
jgi:hypothetical protein